MTCKPDPAFIPPNHEECDIERYLRESPNPAWAAYHLLRAVQRSGALDKCSPYAASLLHRIADYLETYPKSPPLIPGVHV